MNEEERKRLREILLSSKKLEKLLMFEKEKRGINKDRLLFIGMANIALYWWCAMKSLFENREMELAFFSAYLEDRIRYSFELGHIKALPKKPEELLKTRKRYYFQRYRETFKEKS